jgi:hypothetical protein
MGYLNKTTQTVTATFTKRGREILANAISGVSGDYIITKFALGDDEVDYGLWDETQQNNLEGRMIDNMPLLEGFINEQEIMNYFLVDPPPMPASPPVLSGLDSLIILNGFGDVAQIAPITDNFSWVNPATGLTEYTEDYEFILGLDNLADMYQPWLPPIANFMMTVTDGGDPDPDTPPSANFNVQIINEGEQNF